MPNPQDLHLIKFTILDAQHLKNHRCQVKKSPNASGDRLNGMKAV